MKPGTETASDVLRYKEHRHEGHGTRGSVMGRRTYRTPSRQSTWNEQHDAGTMSKVDDDREQSLGQGCQSRLSSYESLGPN